MKTINGRSIPTGAAELCMPECCPVLILIDVQNDFAHPDGLFAKSGVDLELIQQTLPAIRSFLCAARASGLPVIHIHQLTLPDGKSDSDAWLHFKTRSGRDPECCLPNSWGAAPLDGFEPQHNEIVITKFRPDAFLGTNLQQVLRATGHQTTIFAGLFTEGCVESTVRSASYRDHFVVVAEDAVASAIKARHDASLDLMRSRYSLCSSTDILNFLSPKPSSDKQLS